MRPMPCRFGEGAVVGFILTLLGVTEAGLTVTGNKPISKYATHPTIGPLLFGLAFAFMVHLALEVRDGE